MQASIAFTSPGSKWMPFREKKGYTPHSIITEKDSTKKTPNKQTWRGKVCSTIVCLNKDGLAKLQPKPRLLLPMP